MCIRDSSPPAIKDNRRPCPAWVRAIAPRKLPASRASQQSRSVSSTGSYPSARQVSVAAAQSCRTLPVICVVTLVNFFGVSRPSSARAWAETVSYTHLIHDILNGLAGTRLNGETFTLDTLGAEVTPLCDGETDYLQLKTVVDSLTYNDHTAQLTDCVYRVLDSLVQQNSPALTRVVLITTGAEEEQYGYTRQELADLIRKAGFPLYIIGADDGLSLIHICSAAAASSNGAAAWRSKVSARAASCSAVRVFFVVSFIFKFPYRINSVGRAGVSSPAAAPNVSSRSASWQVWAVNWRRKFSAAAPVQ